MTAKCKKCSCVELPLIGNRCLRCYAAFCDLQWATALDTWFEVEGLCMRGLYPMHGAEYMEAKREVDRTRALKLAAELQLKEAAHG